MRYISYTIVLIFLLACNRSENAKSKIQNIELHTMKQEEQLSVDTAAPLPPPPPLPGETKQNSQPPASANAPQSKPDWNKKIIKTASLNIEVKNYKGFNAKVAQAASQFGGYIADEQQSETEYKIENVLTIKVPVDQFQAAVDFLTTGDGTINEKKITSEDVTTQFVDTKSRLEAKRQVRLRYLDLLKQAKNMEEILQVQNEINDIQEEIESAAGRISYLSNASAMSTIQLTYYQVINASAKDTGNSFWAQLKDAFVTGWKGAAEVFVGLISIWPLILIVAGSIWWVRKSVRRKDKKAVTQSTA